MSTKEELLKTDPALKNRPYQLEALLSIFLYAKCLVKMFCGTGKSTIITNVLIHEKKELSVVVFPSLALISQYSADYVNNEKYKKHFKKHKTMNVSSEKLENMESTTDTKEIKKFLKGKGPKIILVTYQSYQVLLDCLDGKRIGLVCYDEAHHVVSPETQKLVFGKDYFEKEVFFTATPKNENGITMFDRDDPEKNMCGPIAYDYTYLQGLTEGYLNAFEICIDMYTENTNNSIYEAIARAILAKGTGRCLSFHSGVNGESNTNVWNFIKADAFKTAFEKVVTSEFPEKAGYYKKITFKGMDGNTPAAERKMMLSDLDETPDDEIYLIGSCETIGEGVDTKKANMCIFADPKSSITKIIQNIGRVVRPNAACPLSTILIPCWVNMENYAEAQGDRAKQDELIRQQMRSEKGDYASILNVLGALKQEDPELYEMCLNYPNRNVKEESLNEQGFMIVEEEEDDTETYTPDEVQEMKDGGEMPLEIHTNETIERFNEEVEDEPLRRLYFDEEDNIFKPIVSISDVDTSEADTSDTESVGEEDDRRIIQPPKPRSSIKMSIHQNEDIQMLWGVKGELDFSKKFCSVVIDCEVIKVDPMEVAIGIVERARARELNGLNLLPKFYRGDKYTIEQNLECKDAMRLSNWSNGLNCNNKVAKLIIKPYLDEFLSGWNDDLDAVALKYAIDLVQRAKERQIKGLNLLPRYRPKKQYPNLSEEHIQENKDKGKLGSWDETLNGKGRARCADNIHKYLNEHLPGWRETLDDKCIKEVEELIKRAKTRKANGGDLLPKQFHHIPANKRTSQQKIEYKDAAKIKNLKRAIEKTDRKNGRVVSKTVIDLLDEHLPGWNESLNDIAIKFAYDIIKRANLRKETGGILLPSNYGKPKNNEEKQERLDDNKLRNWRSALAGSENAVCCDEVRDLLDANLPCWREYKLNDPFIKAQEIVAFVKLHKHMPKSKRKRSVNDTRTNEDRVENSYAQKLSDWRKALNGKKKSICSDELRDYLDKELPGWRPIELPPVKVIAPPPKKRTKKTLIILPDTTEETSEAKTPHKFPPISAIGQLHKTYLKMRSDTLHQKFKADPQLWRDYHFTRKQNFAAYDPASIPANRIIQELEKIKTKRQKVVVDMGCGEASIAHHFLIKNDTRFTFHNYDHQSGGDALIQEVDISALPLEDASAEIAIMSLALWGTQENCIQYIKEAYRVLESGGKFYISDSTKKWSPEPMTKENGGELLRTLLTENGFKIINEDIALPFCLFVCTKVY